MVRKQFLENSITALASAGTDGDMSGVVAVMRDQYGMSNITYRSLKPQGAGKISSSIVRASGLPFSTTASRRR